MVRGSRDMISRMGFPVGALPVFLVFLFALSGASAVAAVAGAPRTLVIGTSYSAPFSTECRTGLFDRVILAAFALLDISLEIRSLPAERSLLDANDGQIDGDVGRVATVAALYPNLRRVPTPVLHSRRFVAFGNCRGPATLSWTDLSRYHVGFVNGWKLFEPIVTDARSVTRVEDSEALFGLLARDRIDLAFSARIDGLMAARRLGLRRFCILDPPIAEVAMYLYLHKRHESLVTPLGEVLAAMTETGATRVIRRNVFARYGLLEEGP